MVLDGWMDGWVGTEWVDGWVDGWIDGRASLRIAYSNQKFSFVMILKFLLHFDPKFTLKLAL